MAHQIVSALFMLTRTQQALQTNREEAMTITTAMSLTVTFTMTAAMLPRIYLAWITAEQHAAEGETESLQALLAEQNRWIARQFCTGAAALAMLLMIKTSRHDLQIPLPMAAAVAGYSVISMFFAVLDSLVAQRVYNLLRQVPAQAGKDCGRER